jgi:hypothetical protein
VAIAKVDHSVPQIAMPISARLAGWAMQKVLQQAIEAVKEAALLLFNSVYVTVSTICRIGFVCAQARIEMK